MPFLPTPEQVAVAWLQTVDEVDSTKVATSLPGDSTVWAATGFWQVTCYPGDNDPHVPVFSPVVRVNCWAANLNSTRPPWGRAGSMAGAVVFACYGSKGNRPTQPELGVEFYAPRILTVTSLGGPVRIPADDSGFARVQVDVQITYTVAGPS